MKENHVGEEEHRTATTEQVKKYLLNESPPQAVVIHCGDPRFQDAFRSFLKDELKLRNYVPIVLGGGIYPFGVQHLLPKNFKILYEQIKFYLKERKINRVVIINHDDCKWYEKFQGYTASIPLSDRLKEDLKSAAKHLSLDYLHVRVETYHARLEGKEIFFEEVK